MAGKRVKATGTRKKRRGGRFFVSFLILLIAGAAVFYFGWVQFQVDEGEYAVIHTKTNGYEDTPIKSGEFAWRWQALLPTNLTVHSFSLKNRYLDVSQSGTLPSGESYAIVAGPDVNFDWSIAASVSYRLKPEALPELIKNGFSNTGLETFYLDFEQKLTTRLGEELVDLGMSASVNTLIPDYAALETKLKSDAANLDNRIEILSVSLKSIKFPDMELYAESRRLYLSLMEQRKAVLAEVEQSSTMREDIQGARLSLLERYGKVLSDYPVLLDLFALDGNPGGSLLPPEDLQ